MTRMAMTVLAASSLLRLCGAKPADNAAAASAVANGSVLPAMIPEHGGSVAVSGGITTEVAAQPDGRIVAYVRDPQHAPIRAHDVTLGIQKPDGQVQTVPLTFDPTLQAFVGRPAGLAPGSYPMQLSVKTTATSPPVQLVTPDVAITTSMAIPPARYGGRVEVVGDHAVEIVSTPTGDVAMFWMDLQGNPIPAAQVAAPTVTVTVNGRTHTVQTQPEGDRFIARVPTAMNGNVAVAVPNVAVMGVPYRGVVLHVAPVIAQLPPRVMVRAPGVMGAGFVQAGGIAPPPPSGVAFGVAGPNGQVPMPDPSQAMPSVGFQAQRPVFNGQPGVIVQAPMPGVAMPVPQPGFQGPSVGIAQPGFQGPAMPVPQPGFQGPAMPPGFQGPPMPRVGVGVEVGAGGPPGPEGDGRRGRWRDHGGGEDDHGDHGDRGDHGDHGGDRGDHGNHGDHGDRGGGGERGRGE